MDVGPGQGEKAMTADDFRNLAMIHGADIARWPERDRRAAAAMAGEAWAAELLADLAAIEADLSAIDVAAPSPDRVGRSIAGTLARIAEPRRPSVGRILAWIAAGGGGLAASAALGVVLALRGPLAVPGLDPITLVVESGDLSVLLPGLGG